MIDPIKPPYSSDVGSNNTRMLYQNPKKRIGVYGTYKKGFHNHEKLGNNAKFMGMATLEGAMYLVDTYSEPFPILYLNPSDPTLKKDYNLELYEIDSSEFMKIQTKEINDHGKCVTVFVEDKDYQVFVTDPLQRTEPTKISWISDFDKKEFGAYIGGDVTVHALTEKIAEEKLKEMFDDAAECLEKESHVEAATVLKKLSLYMHHNEKRQSDKVREGKSEVTATS